MPYSPRVSVYEHIHSAVGRETAIISLSKVTLVRLSHLLEDVVLRYRLPALIFAGFQAASHWHEASERYQQLDGLAKQVVIFAGEELPPENTDAMLHVQLHEQDMLGREWFLVIYSAEFSVVLCGLDVDNGTSTAVEAERQLDTLVTFDPAIVNQVIDALEHVVAYYRPKRLIQLQFARQTYPPPGELDPRIITLIAADILRFEETLVQQLHESEERRLALEKEHEITHARNYTMMTIAHEFRTPLAIIASAAQILDLYADHLTPEQQHERLQSILTQVERLSEMINDLSRITQKVHQEQTLRLETVNLVDLCRVIVNEFQTSIGVAHLLSFTVDDTPDEMEVDKRLISQIVTNLLSNAIKYSEPMTKVRLDLSRHESSVVMQVSDQGIGIPKNELQHIFDPFYRSSNVGLTVGLGLGLAIVRNAVLLHGGTILVDSQPDEGTTFTIHLPIRHSEPSTPG